MTIVRLNKDIDNKLKVLTEIEKSSKSEVIKKAIAAYYNRHVQDKSPYELGKELFGKYGSEEKLSSTYKKRVKGKLNEKTLIDARPIIALFNKYDQKILSLFIKLISTRKLFSKSLHKRERSA